MRTLFDGVFQVPPGHYLLATDRHVQLHRYWDFDYPIGDGSEAKRSDADYAAEFREALEEAVRIRLRADVPVGCYLSGGLDSCSVLGLAAWHHPEPIRAFTLTFDRAEYDEQAHAKEMAARAGAEFFPIPIRQDDLADHFSDAILQSETLCFNAHGVAKYLLSRAVRDAGYKVVMTGEGSDEILAGYAHFRRDMLLYNRDGSGSGRDHWPARRAGKVQSRLPRPAAAGRGSGAARWGEADSRVCALLDRDVLGSLAKDAGGDGWGLPRKIRSSAKTSTRYLTRSISAASLPDASPCISRSTSGRRRCCPATS